MTARNRSILLAAIGDDITTLAAPLAERGFSPTLCNDGSQTLAKALEILPELLVIETALPAIPVDRLGQILRANPRLRELSIIFIGHEGERVEGFQRHRDQFLARPFNREQLLTEVVRLFNRRERARQVGGQEKEVAGNLQQIALVDLLQIFGLNHKSGTLTLRRGKERALVYLQDGRVVNARSGPVDGLKAFYRLLTWEEGTFTFTPGDPDIAALIDAPTDHLIMEGLRQCDEMQALAGTLPAADARLTLRIPRERLPQGLRPATQEILLRLEYYPRVGDLLDHSALPDFEALQVLKVLLEKGVVEEQREVDATIQSRVPLLTAAEILRVRDRFGERESLLEQTTGKLLLLATDPDQVRGFAQALQGVTEFEPDDAFLVGDRELGPGDLGRLALAETFALRLCVLPATVEMAPLWAAFANRLFGVALLGSPASLAEAERFFRQLGAAPVATVGGGAAGTDGFTLRRGDRRGLSRLLGFFAGLEADAVSGP